MKSANSNQLIKQIDDAISKANKFVTASQQSLQLEMDSYLAQFLIVFICGIYEAIIEATVSEMARKSGSKEIESFAKNTMDSYFMNPNMDKVAKLIKKFENQSWIDAINNLPPVNKSALTSISQNKNGLAHGQSALNLTISDVEKYYLDSKLVIEKIDELLL